MNRVARRIARELAPAPSSAARLRLTREGTRGTIAEDGKAPLDASHDALDEVTVARGVYERVRGTDARSELLARAAAIAPRVVVIVEPRDTARHAVRVAVDGPRRVLRAVGVSVPEPGDRFPDDGYVHVFVDDEAIFAEAARAGLAPVRRERERLVFERGTHREHAASFASELARVARAFPRILELMREPSPERMVTAARALGRAERARGPIGRARLHRAVSWVDAVTPPGPSCLRRVLTEVALDRGAANETLVFGLDVGRTGHVAFLGREVLRFDVAFEIPP